MTFTISQNVPKNVESNFLEYLSAEYNQQPVRLGQTLTKNVIVEVYATLNDNPGAWSKTEGRANVVELALKISRLVQTIDAIDIRFAMVTNTENGDQFLAVKYITKMEIGQNNNSRSADWNANGDFLWQVSEKITKHKTLKTQFSAGYAYENDRISKEAIEENKCINAVKNANWGDWKKIDASMLEKIRSKQSIIETSNEEAQNSDLSSRSCFIL